MSSPDDDPVCTFRRHPDGDPSEPDTTRVVKIAVAHPGEWPWRRATGATFVPQFADLSDWPVQPAGDVALACDHPVILGGREVFRG